MEVPRTEFSARALALLQSPRFAQLAPTTPHGERQYSDGRVVWWSGSEICAEWGYWGAWSAGDKILLEAAGQLIKGQKWGRLEELSARELEFFLRDRNSVPALEETLVEGFAQTWTELKAVIHEWRQSGLSLRPYTYSQKLPFGALKTVDKIHEFKAFLLSDKLMGFYQRGGRIELLDVEDCTLFIALDTGDIPQGAFLDWLQIVAAEALSEPAINLIPEPFPSGTAKKTV